MDFTNRSDIANLFFRIGVPLVGCVAAAMATVYMMQEINPLAAFCVCASAVFFVMAAVSPRAGVILLLLQCAYSDLLKRMLVFWGDLSFEQVSYVLIGAPLVVAGLFVSVITQSAFHRLRISSRDFLLLAAVGVAMALNFFLAKRAGAETLESLKQAANNGLYLTLTPIAMKLIQSPEQIGRVLLNARLIFMPVAAYGIFQAIFGLADFEIEYLKSGLTIMVKELFDVRPRPFSTLNSGTALSVIASAFALLSLYPLIIRGRRTPIGERIKSISLSLLYLTSAVVSLVRGGIMVWIVGLVALWCFGSRVRTRVFYISGVAAFALLIAASPYLIDNIAVWDPANNVDSEVIGQAVRLQTYSERLKGFVNLTRSTDMYSLIGLPEYQKMTETTWNHDPISSLLVDFGLVGLVTVATILILALRFIHVRLLALPEGPVRATAVLLAAINAGILVSHMLFNGIFGTFPINAFFWLFAGMLGVLLLRKDGETAPDEVIDVPAPEPRWSRVGATSEPALAGEERFRRRYDGRGGGSRRS